jgi:hypothetical protein
MAEPTGGGKSEAYLALADSTLICALCSNDPFCASHDPNSELEKRYAHGAACHGCLLIAATSCERRNEMPRRRGAVAHPGFSMAFSPLRRHRAPASGGRSPLVRLWLLDRSAQPSARCRLVLRTAALRRARELQATWGAGGLW